MYAAVKAERDTAQAIVMAAAVADYTPAGGPAGDKVKKQDGALTVTFERTVDILADLGRWRGDRRSPVLVGFAAETSDVIGYASQKLEAKRVDLIVANDVTAPGAGFDHETNRVTFVGHDGDESLPLLAKAEVAALLLDRIEALLRSPQVPAESTAVE
jgi:phosphopantothenoylcysteine decarboxylase/phosphopantothenate--cysteine ligase